MTPGAAKAAKLHLRYIERDGVEKDGSKGVLYGPDGPVERRTFEEPRLHEKHQFRIIVSPEDAGELELTGYVQILMKRIQTDVGRQLEWAAVNHYDTAHPHAHIVVRGVDLDGREVRFDRGYISNGMRWRAQELAYHELGPRRESEVRRTYEREVTQDRFTSLDRELERLSVEGSLELRTPRVRTRIDLSVLHARLDHLESMRLVERQSSNLWTFTEGWQESLRRLGVRRDIIKQMHEVVRGDSARYSVVKEGEPVPTGPHGVQPDTVGRVAGKGLSDEMKGAFYAVVETPDGRAYHMPIDTKTAEAVRVGDLVTFGSRPEPAVRPMDRHIAESARSAGGVFVAEADGEERLRAGLERRLRELERVGLVAQQAPGRWSVPADLVERLEREPGPELRRERVWLRKGPLALEAMPEHRGPVWLDGADTSTMARWGDGASAMRSGRP
jgi:type IV secretory pathway VirD2 relaxase